MATRTYGKRTRSYEVIERENGWIDLLVYHKNKDMRETLKRHKSEPQYFYERRKQYRLNNLTAKKWLAQVIDDYCTCFKKGRVKFVFQ